MIRTFIAFDTTPEQKQTLRGIATELQHSGADVRWEPANKYHATVKFLGDTDEKVLQQLRDAIARVCARTKPVEIVIDRFGVFPNLRDPKVLWAGCTNDYPALTSLKISLDQALADFGFESDPRRFHPHITLGRVKGLRRVDDLISTIETVTFESFNLAIKELQLIQSILRREGSVYTMLDSFPLGGNPVG